MRNRAVNTVPKGLGDCEAIRAGIVDLPKAARATSVRRVRDIEARIAASFRRLYRNRNIVLHGGKTDAVGLRACLRISARLVGTGLNRIAHAAYTENLRPLELAARARIRLDLLDSAAAAPPIDLLS